MTPAEAGQLAVVVAYDARQAKMQIRNKKFKGAASIGVDGGWNEDLPAELRAVR